MSHGIPPPLPSDIPGAGSTPLTGPTSKMAGEIPSATPVSPTQPVPPPAPKYDFKIGSAGPHGVEIEFIYAQSIDVVIYRGKGAGDLWAVRPDTLSNVQIAAKSAFDNQCSRVNKWLTGNERNWCYTELANGFFLALSAADAKSALAMLADAIGRADAEIAFVAKRTYLCTGAWSAFSVLAIAAAILTCGFWLDIDNLITFSVAVAGSAFGSWTSILQRTPNLPLATTEVKGHVSFQSGYRILLGVTFGIVAYFFVKTGQLPVASASNWNLLLLSFVAGFSERLIPELLQKVETATVKDKPAVPTVIATNTASTEVDTAQPLKIAGEIVQSGGQQSATGAPQISANRTTGNDAGKKYQEDTKQ